MHCRSIECGFAQQPMATIESLRKKYGMGFWRHELGAIVVVALKNTLKRSGLGYGKLPWPIGGRQIADSMTTKALELDGERRFLLRLDELCVALPNAARYREAASKGCNGWRVDSDWRPLASILSLLGWRRRLKKGKEKKHETESEQ
jgi:hypothetical protein